MKRNKETQNYMINSPETKDVPVGIDQSQQNISRSNQRVLSTTWSCFH